MKTAHAIDLAGSAAKLAAILEITPSAVSQWPVDVPEARVWQLRVLRPSWFQDPDPHAEAEASQPVLVLDKKA